MTEKQKKFAYAYVMDGLCRSEAYRRAYSADGLSAAEISRRADKVMQSDRVACEIARLQKICRDAEIISRDELLRNVKELMETARDNSYGVELTADGEERRVIQPRSAEIYIKAIDRAAKLIGADEPEKTQSEVVVKMDEGLKKYGS